MPKFRNRPVEIEAWLNDPLDDMPNWVIDEVLEADDGALYLHTLEGKMRADVGDWVILGIKGEVYPCKPDIFAATYEPVV